MLTKCTVFYSFFLLLFTLSSYGQTSFFDEYSDIKPIKSLESSEMEGWHNYYFSNEDCMCVYGDEFFVSIQKAASETANLMISLQGGGACWPGKIQCKPKTFEADVRAGYFAKQLEERIGEEWNQVVIPYCDGSIYLGETEQDYDGDNEIDHWHNGLKNSVVALSQVYKSFPDVSKIFLTGCSAGGYGSIIQVRLLKYLYPDASIYVLNESGPGLFRPTTDFWNMIDASWNLKQLLPNNCVPCKGQLIYWYEEMLRDPKIKIGLYSAYKDQVIGQAFLEMEPEDFKELLLSSSGYLNSKYPDQFKRFFIKGNSHCVEDRNYLVHGVKYWDWILAFINDEEGWEDLLE